jgi:hypothetical protein
VGPYPFRGMNTTVSNKHTKRLFQPFAFFHPIISAVYL